MIDAAVNISEHDLWVHSWLFLGMEILVQRLQTFLRVLILTHCPPEQLLQFIYQPTVQEDGSFPPICTITGHELHFALFFFHYNLCPIWGWRSLVNSHLIAFMSHFSFSELFLYCGPHSLLFVDLWKKYRMNKTVDIQLETSFICIFKVAMR